MLENLLLNLQLFGEGGDGGDGGEANPTGENVSGNSGEDLIPASIPEKATKTAALWFTTIVRQSCRRSP